MNKGFIIVVCAVMLISGLAGCDPPPPPEPPDPTDNNSFEDAWNVNLPYGIILPVPETDSAEYFHFGIGSRDEFAHVILIRVEVLEPAETSFYLRAELFTENQSLLVSSRDTELVPAAWIATRPEHTFYLRLTPVGSMPDGKYRYSLNVSSAAVNDAFEPDDDTGSANPLLVGIESTGAYLVDAYSDTGPYTASLPDFYSFDVDEENRYYIYVDRLGADTKPLLRVYSPDGEIFAELEDTAATLDLFDADFQAGKWFVEITDREGFYPIYGEGEVAENFFQAYLVLVSKTP